MSTTSLEVGRRKRGQFVKTADSVERDRQALEMVGRGYSYREISDALGYGGAANAKRSVDKVLVDILTPAGEEARAVLLAQNAAVTREAWLVFDANPPVVTVGGKVATDQNGNPVVDHGLKLAALDRIHRGLAERAKLLGAYPATRVEVEQDSREVHEKIAVLLQSFMEPVRPLELPAGEEKG